MKKMIKGIIPVHLFGKTVDLERLEKIKIRGILKLIICLVLIWLGLYCTIYKI